MQFGRETCYTVGLGRVLENLLPQLWEAHEFSRNESWSASPKTCRNDLRNSDGLVLMYEYVWVFNQGRILCIFDTKRHTWERMHTHAHINRHTHKHTQIHTHKHTHTHSHTHTNTHTHTQPSTHESKCTHTHAHVKRNAQQHTNKWAHKPKRTNTHAQHINRHTNTHKHNT